MARGEYMAADNLTNLGAGICADLASIRWIDSKGGSWTPAEKEKITMLLKHLKAETDKAISYYKRRGIDIDK
jgi:hypothetical protein